MSSEEEEEDISFTYYDLEDTSSISIHLEEDGYRTIGIQVTKRQENESTQAGTSYLKGTLHRMFMTKSDVTKTEDVPDDPITLAFGNFGLWQGLVQLMLFLYNIPYVFQLVVDEYESHLFGDYWCARPSHLASLTVDQWKNISGVYSKNTAGVLVYDPCKIKAMNYENLNPQDPASWVTHGQPVDCKSWEFEEHFSLLSEWNLTCIRPSVKTLSETSFSVGGIVGGVLNGYVMDIMGRRSYLIICLIANGIISYFTALSNQYVVYLVLRGVQGFCIIGCYPALVILSLEVTGPGWFGIIGSIFMYSFPLGYVISALYSYHISNWRHLHFAGAILSLSLLTGCWVLPESPRWLWIRKRYGDLIKHAEDAYYMNGSPIIDHKITLKLRCSGPMIMGTRELKTRFRDLIATKTIRKCTLVSIPLFLFTYFAYYGIVLRLNSLYSPEEIYRSNLYSGVIDLTATAVSLSLSAKMWMNDFMTLFLSSISAGVLFLFLNGLSNDSFGITYCLVGIRFFMAIVNTGLVNIIAKLYPTTIRGIGVCSSHIFSFLAMCLLANRFGLEQLFEGLTIFLMGMSGVVAGFLVLLLPRPDDDNFIPDTVKQAEDPTGRDQSNARFSHETIGILTDRVYLK